jgi:hypothetical protein
VGTSIRTASSGAGELAARGRVFQPHWYWGGWFAYTAAMLIQ